MLLHEDLTHIQSQIKPRLLFGESFAFMGPKPIWRVKNSDNWYIGQLDIKYITTNILFSDPLHIVQTLETKIWTESRTFYCYTFIKCAKINKVLQICLKVRGAFWNSDVKYYKSSLHEYSLYLQMMNSLSSLYLDHCVVNHSKAKHTKVIKWLSGHKSDKFNISKSTFQQFE